MKKTRNLFILAFVLVFLIVLVLLYNFVFNTHSYKVLNLENINPQTFTRPIVQEYQVDDSHYLFELNDKSRIIFYDEQFKDRESLKKFNQKLIEKNIIKDKLPIYINKNRRYNDISFEVNADLSNNKQAYRIVVSKKGVRVIMASKSCFSYALNTLENLLSKNMLVFGKITDYPNILERKISLDIGKKYFSKESIIKLLDDMNENNFNALQLHFSDNNGFRIECETDRAIVSSDGYLKKKEVLEIIKYANDLDIDIIPALNSTSHLGKILSVHKEFRAKGLDGKTNENCLDISNNEAISYMKSLYKEYLELFADSKAFQIGGDQFMVFDDYPFYDVYKPFLDEHAKQPNHGYKDLYTEYLNEVAKMVHEKNIEPRVYNDGMYYDLEENPQFVDLNSYIGIDYWSKSSYLGNVADVDTFVRKGHNNIYNLNENLFYYFLRYEPLTKNGPLRGFENENQAEIIYDNWTITDFSGQIFNGDLNNIKGVGISIWCDNYNLVDEMTVLNDIKNVVKALGAKAWNLESPDILKFKEYFVEN